MERRANHALARRFYLYGGIVANPLEHCMTDEKVADLLEKSAELLEKNGWIKGNLGGVGGFCAIGAIRWIAWGNLNSPQWNDSVIDRESQAIEVGRAVQLLSETIQNIDPPGLYAEDTDECFVMAWNDDEERERQQVLDMFHRAAKAAHGVEV